MPKITANSDFDHLLDLQQILIQSQRNHFHDEKYVDAMITARLPLLSFGVQQALQERYIKPQRLIDSTQANPIGTTTLLKKREYFSQLFRSEVKTFIESHFALSPEQRKANELSAERKLTTNTKPSTFQWLFGAKPTTTTTAPSTHNPLLDEHQQNNDYGLLLALQAKVEEQKNPTLPQAKTLQRFALVPSFYLEKTIFKHLSERVQDLLLEQYVSSHLVFRPYQADAFLQLTSAQLAAMAQFDLSTLHENVPIVEPEIAISSAVVALETSTPEIAGTTVAHTETITMPSSAIVTPASATFVDAGTMEMNTTPPLTSVSMAASSTAATTLGHNLTTNAAFNTNALTTDDFNFDAIELTVRTRPPV